MMALYECKNAAELLLKEIIKCNENYSIKLKCLLFKMHKSKAMKISISGIHMQHTLRGAGAGGGVCLLL